MILTKCAVKAKLLEYFRYVETSGEEIIVTDNGRMGAKLIVRSIVATARLYDDLLVTADRRILDFYSKARW